MDDPDLMTEKWLDQFTEILDQIAPFRQRKVKNSYAPFIDKELRQKMLLRDLHKKNILSTRIQKIGSNINNLEMKSILK